mmetsp:Transcript_18951/g.58838  ORF Transcript_18951/g.58838 Transcript_18951/m.58838 type:complete len:201 (+) Transcript_18951:306-908(+)
MPKVVHDQRTIGSKRGSTDAREEGQSCSKRDRVRRRAKKVPSRGADPSEGSKRARVCVHEYANRERDEAVACSAGLRRSWRSTQGGDEYLVRFRWKVLLVIIFTQNKGATPPSSALAGEVGAVRPLWCPRCGHVFICQLVFLPPREVYSSYECGRRRAAPSSEEFPAHAQRGAFACSPRGGGLTARWQRRVVGTSPLGRG